MRNTSNIYLIPKTISLDELVDSSEEKRCCNFEYKLGMYTQMNIDEIGIISDIKRLIKEGYFPKKERDVLKKCLEDKNNFNSAQRSAKKRAIKRLKNYFK